MKNITLTILGLIFLGLFLGGNNHSYAGEEASTIDNSDILYELEKQLDASGANDTEKILLSAAKCQMLGKMEEAEKLFLKAIADSSDMPDTYFSYIMFLVNENRVDDAIRYSREAGQKFPDNLLIGRLREGIEGYNNKRSEGRNSLKAEIQRFYEDQGIKIIVPSQTP